MPPVIKYKFDHLDAESNAFVSRTLEQVRSTVYKVEYPALKMRSFVPFTSEINPGAEAFVQHWYDRTGKARVTSDYGKAGPRVDIVAGEYTQVVRTIEVAYGLSMQEMRASQFAGINLMARKAEAARDAIETEIDDIALNGDSSTGLKGLLNAVGASTMTLGATWVSATSLQMLADLHSFARKIRVDSNSVEDPDTLVMPAGAFYKISNTRMSADNSRTVLQTFLEQSGNLKEVTYYDKLNTANKAICYKKDPSKLRFEVPMAFTQLQPQFIGKEYVTECEARVAGLVADKPKSILIIDGFGSL